MLLQNYPVTTALEKAGLQVPFAAFFEEICSIPHGSYHTRAISDYCAVFAEERGLKYVQDEANNVVIFKPGTAGREKEPAMILQGHLDMVCDVAAGLDIDMEKDGVIPETDGEWIWARGTTLGADNGIAVAYALALLDSRELSHPPLEVVFTTEEEVGMDGAKALDMSVLTGRRMLNVDSEEEGIFTAGCAGGVRLDIAIPCPKTLKTGYAVELSVDGLQGGHSGIMIHVGRANACKVMGTVLAAVGECMLADLQGGQKDNAIAMWCTATVLVQDTQGIEEKLNQVYAALKQAYAQVDPGLNLVWKIAGEPSEVVAADVDTTGGIVTFLNTLPNGVQKYMESMPELPETSMNLGILNMSRDTMTVRVSIRSSIDEVLHSTVEQVRALAQSTGAAIEEQGAYPGWEFRTRSSLRDLCLSTYEEQTGKRGKIDVIHAGLECGIFCAGLPGLDVVSMGPDLFDVHTARERMNVASAVRVWEFIKALLERC